MSEGRTVSRPTQSCFQCRNRKIKCNRSHPCAACLLRGEGDTCHEVEKIIARAIGPGVTVEAVDEVLSKVVALEQSVSKLSKMISKNGPVEDSSETESMHHLGPQKRVLSSPPPAGSKIQATRPEQKASMMLADQLAMGNRMNGRRNSMQSEAERAISSSPVDPPIPLPSSSKFPPNANGISHDHPLSLLVRPATSIVFQILSHLPDETDSRSLIRFYFDRIEWYTRILHYPTFSYDAKILTRQISDSASSASSGSTAATHFSLPFLSTYFMVLCLAYHFIEFDMCKVLDNTFEDAAKMSKKMYNAAQLCLWIDNYLENHSLEGVQTLILMGIYQQNLGDSDSHWALLGSAIKIAQILGVDRLGTESDRKSYPGPWKSVVRREVGRRVWWNLIHNEWSNAATHNGAYTIVPSQNNTGLPLNVNDIDLEDDLDPIEPAPHTEYTEMTYSLMRFRFVEIHRQIMDSVENHPTGFRPSFITEIDSRVLTMLKDLPAAFQAPGVSTGERSSLSFKGVKSIEYTISLITAEAMRMRLHRPFLFRGYTEERYGPSKQQCVASAKAILKYLKYDIGQTTVLLRRWSVMFFGFTAAIVLLVDYCQQKGAGALQDSRKELQSALNMFKMVQVSSNAAQSFIPLLESMVAAAERNLTSNTSNKHSGGHHDVWSEIAKEAFATLNADGKIGPQHLAPLLPSILVPNETSANPPSSPSSFFESLVLPKPRRQDGRDRNEYEYEAHPHAPHHYAGRSTANHREVY